MKFKNSVRSFGFRPLISALRPWLLIPENNLRLRPGNLALLDGGPNRLMN